MRVQPLFTEYNMSRSYCKYRKTLCCSLLMSLASLTGNHLWNVLWKHYRRQKKKNETSQDSGWRPFRWVWVQKPLAGCQYLLWSCEYLLSIQCPRLDSSLCWSCAKLSLSQSGYLIHPQGQLLTKLISRLKKAAHVNTRSKKSTAWNEQG